MLKQFTQRSIQSSGILLLLFMVPAIAFEVEGVKLPDLVNVGANGHTLVLNGAGVRKHWVFKIYVAALYLPMKLTDGEAILRLDQPRRLLLHFVRTLTAEQIKTSMNDALQETLTQEERSSVGPRIMQFNAIFDGIGVVTEGTEIVIDYLPRLGSIVRVNGKDQAQIPGADFNQALLRMWIGDKPRDIELKKVMLGT